jgi:hypothetical protein
VSFPMHGRELPAARSYTGGLWRTAVVPRGREPFGFWTGCSHVRGPHDGQARKDRPPGVLRCIENLAEPLPILCRQRPTVWQRPALQQGDDKRRRGAKHRGDQAPTNLGQLAIEGDDFLPQNAVVVREALNRGT